MIWANKCVGDIMSNTLKLIAKSWTTGSGIHDIQEILEWIEEGNKNIQVSVRKTRLSDSNQWYYDELEGSIHNLQHSFFSITGFQKFTDHACVAEQPIIIQDEIGLLGILCKEINGVMHFLMQAKIEPGNVNRIQISPTIQATKSNFTQKHGGAKPQYLGYFENAGKYEIVVDQLQSEQSSRFFKKRNRNIILRVREDIPVQPSHRWMTLGQIKRLMRKDNLVNMDTRTVISCIPFSRLHLSSKEQEEMLSMFVNEALFRSLFEEEADNLLPPIYHYLNNYKMFTHSRGMIVPLCSLKNWIIEDDRIFCRTPYPYQVIFCDIAIEGREVKRWTQPLFEAIGIATFGLICCEQDGVQKFLVRATPELGCFDGLELGPTVQQEAVPMPGHKETEIDRFFFERLLQGKGVFFDHLLSEEGGRFYHEQNRNVLMQIAEEELPQLPEGYFWVDYRTLNELVQINNTLNIQLRNLLSLLEA